MASGAAVAVVVRRSRRPTSYVTRIPGREAWRTIMEDYRRRGPTLGATAASGSDGYTREIVMVGGQPRVRIVDPVPLLEGEVEIDLSDLDPQTMRASVVGLLALLDLQSRSLGDCASERAVTEGPITGARGE